MVQQTPSYRQAFLLYFETLKKLCNTLALPWRAQACPSRIRFLLVVKNRPAVSGSEKDLLSNLKVL